MKRFFSVLIAVFFCTTIYGETVFVGKISTKTEQDLKATIYKMLEQNDFQVTDEKEKADLILSLFSDVTPKRNLNWGGWLVAYPLFGIFHDVANAETTLKITNKNGDVVFKETVRQGVKEGYLFSDFKGGFKKISEKAEKMAIEKGLKRFFADNRL